MLPLLALAAALAAQPVAPDDPSALRAEARRIGEEMKSYASQGKSAGVVRSYTQLLALGVQVDPELHQLAAEVAQDRGEVLAALVRMSRVPVGSRVGTKASELSEQAAQTYCYARVTAKPGLEVQAPSFFSPDESKAATAFVEAIRDDGVFLGLVPAGEYVIDGQKVPFTGAQIACWPPDPRGNGPVACMPAPVPPAP